MRVVVVVVVDGVPKWSGRGCVVDNTDDDDDDDGNAKRVNR